MQTSLLRFSLFMIKPKTRADSLFQNQTEDENTTNGIVRTAKQGPRVTQIYKLNTKQLL